MVILLSREYGSGGRVIGEEVAKRLGYSFYDKEMIGNDELFLQGSKKTPKSVMTGNQLKCY